MQYQQEDFISVEEFTKVQERVTVEAKEEDLEEVRKTNIRDIVEPYYSFPYETQVQMKIKDI